LGSQFGHPSFRLKHSIFCFLFLGFKFIFEVSLKTFELNLSNWKMFVIPLFSNFGFLSFFLSYFPLNENK
jgi:hypothetical protein